MPKTTKTTETPKNTFPIVKIQQTRSMIRRDAKQGLYLKSLGLGKINRVRELEANPTVLGLIKKAHHMIRIITE